MVGYSCVAFAHGCSCDGSAAFNVSGHRLPYAKPERLCCPKPRIPVGNPILLAPNARADSSCCCLPPPCVPLVPNVCNVPINCPPRCSNKVPDFLPPLPPCIPVPPMRMVAMPLSKCAPSCPGGSCGECCGPCHM